MSLTFFYIATLSSPAILFAIYTFLSEITSPLIPIDRFAASILSAIVEADIEFV